MRATLDVLSSTAFSKPIAATIGSDPRRTSAASKGGGLFTPKAGALDLPQRVKQAGKTNFEIIDEIYAEEKQRLENEINRTVYERAHRKTLAQERIETLEQDIRRQFYIQTSRVNQLRIAEVNEKHHSLDQHTQNMEKLRGRFKLRINSHMPNHKKFEHFAEEQVAFHLHKRRLFLKRVVDTVKKRKRRRRHVHHSHNPSPGPLGLSGEQDPDAPPGQEEPPAERTKGVLSRRIEEIQRQRRGSDDNESVSDVSSIKKARTMARIQVERAHVRAQSQFHAAARGAQPAKNSGKGSGRNSPQPSTRVISPFIENEIRLEFSTDNQNEAASGGQLLMPQGGVNSNDGIFSPLVKNSSK